MKVSLVVPIFNNRANAEAFCADFLKARLGDTHLTIVDNGSIEAESLRHLTKLAPDRIKVVSLMVNEGFGGGIQAGIKQTHSEWISWLPGNMKVLPTGLREFIHCVRSQDPHTVVKAYRSGRSLIPLGKTFLASVAQSLVSRTWLLDTGGTPTAVNVNNPILADLLDGPKDYSFESFVLFIAKLRGLKVIRINVVYGERLFGHSHWQSGLKSELRLMGDILSRIPKWRASYKNQRRRVNID